MKEHTKYYELLIWETSDEMAEAVVARHTALAIADSDDEYHCRGTFSDVLASGMLCTSLNSVLESVRGDRALSGSQWHRHMTPSFDRVFDLLLEETRAIFDLDGHPLEIAAEQIRDLQHAARQRETELNLGYAMRNAPPNQG